MARARGRGHRLCGLSFAARLCVLRARLLACRPQPPVESAEPSARLALVLLGTGPQTEAARPRFGRRVTLARRAHAA